MLSPALKNLFRNQITVFKPKGKLWHRLPATRLVCMSPGGMAKGSSRPPRYRTEDPRFEYRQGVRFFGIYVHMYCTAVVIT
jgi:hypothetical protein